MDDMAELLEYFGVPRLPYDQRDRSVRDLVDLTGVRVAVAGGGGANLGSVIVGRMAGLGADIAVIDYDAGAASAVAAATAERWGVEAVAVEADIATWDGAHEAVAQSVAALGGIDVWVNNVGGGAGMFLEMDEAAILRTISMSLMTTINCTRAVLPHMVERGSGRVISISSEASKMGAPGLAVYAACKAAVDSLTRNLAHEVGPKGVGLVTVNPGMMLGEGQLESLNHPEKWQARIASMKVVRPRITAGRGCLPEEVANMVAFLATPAGSYVQGTSVSVGGGMSS